MNNNKKTWLAQSVLAPIGLLMALAATLVPFFLMHTAWAQAAYPYLYSAGALVVLVSRIFTPKADDRKLRSLRRLEVWIGIIFCVAAAFLFVPGAMLRDWLAFTLAGAALQVYTSLAIPAREAKIRKGE